MFLGSCNIRMKKLIRNKLCRFKKQKKVVCTSVNSYSHYVILTCILIITFFLYKPSLNNKLTNFDDDVYVTENPYIYALTTENISKIFTDYYYGGYYPLTLISFAIDYSIGGTEPYNFHLTNLLLHLICIFFIYLIIRKIFKNNLIAAITALLFGIHPLHVESIAWVSERKDVLYGAFFFASIFTYIYYVEKRKAWLIILSIILFIFSVLSKTMAVSLAATIIAIDWFLGRDLKSNKVWFEKIPFLIIAIAFGIINIYSQKSIGAISTDNMLPILHRIVFASYSFCLYLIKLLIPFNLSAFYPFPVSGSDPTPFIYWLSVIPVFAFLLLLYFLRKHRKYGFAVWFFALNIVLVLQILQVNDFLMADRYTYVASVGFFAAIGLTIEWLIRRKQALKKMFLSIFAVYCIILMVKTNDRIKIWSDSITLWNDIIDKYPAVYKAWYKRGQAKMDELQDCNEAIYDFNKAIKINPGFYDAYINRGLAFTSLNKQNLALDDFETAIKLKPFFYMGYNNRGATKANLKNFKGAIIDFSKAIELEPKNGSSYINRGRVRVTLNDFEGAIQDYNKAVEVDPLYYPAYNFSGQIFLQQRKFIEALKEFNKCLEIYPYFTEALYNRGIVQMHLKNYRLACNDFNKAANLGYQRAYFFLNRYCSCKANLSQIKYFSKFKKIQE
jgi:protein O-mannosyl-transferase